jgi:hypothetical protein
MLIGGGVILIGGVVVAWMLAYRWADGDTHWTVMAGCSWSTAWMVLFLALTRLVVAIMVSKKPMNDPDQRLGVK